MFIICNLPKGLILYFPYMDHSVILMRHAQSIHNLEKKKWKQQHHQNHHKSHPEYTRLRYSLALIDRPQINQHQVHNTLKTLDLNSVGLILCSPLKRCLSTAQLLLAHHPTLNVIVEPFLSSRLCSAWSIGTYTTLLKQQYPKFDFSLLQREGEVWIEKYLPKQEMTSSKKCRSRIQTVEQILKIIQRGKGEGYTLFQERVQQVKQRIREMRTKGKCQSNKSILIISHSCVMNVLLGKKYDAINGKIKNKISFQYCVPVKFTTLTDNGSQIHTEQLKPKL